MPTYWLDRIKHYMTVFDVRGAASLERGGQKGVLHIQALMEVTCGTDEAAGAAFKQHLKSHIPINSTDRGKLTFKPLAEGQTFVHMLGYVQKDAGKPHYKLVSHNVTPAELEEGRQAYKDIAADFKVGKVTISKSGLPDRLYSFWHSNYRPFYVPMDVMLVHMLRSGMYAPCGTWCAVGHGQPADPAVQAAMQMIIMRPSSVTLGHVRTLFFGTHRVVGKFRYFSTNDWDDNVSLTPVQQKVSHIWHMHAYEVTTMATVVFEMRQALLAAGVSYDDGETIDSAFVECFEDVYQRVSGRHSLWRTFGPSGAERPVNELPSWEVRYDNCPDRQVLGAARGVSTFSWMNGEDAFDWEADGAGGVAGAGVGAEGADDGADEQNVGSE